MTLAAVGGEPPLAGRPAWFAGAAGSFRVAAQVEPREFRVGEIVQYTLTVTGSGDLAHATPPRFDAQRGFADQFEIVGEPAAHPSADGVTYTYQLRPRDGTVTAVPSLRYSFFNPATSRYETVLASAQPLTVLPMTSVGSDAVVAAPLPEVPIRQPNQTLRRLLLIGVAAALAGLTAWLLMRSPPVPASEPMRTALPAEKRRDPHTVSVDVATCARRFEELREAGNVTDAIALAEQLRREFGRELGLPPGRHDAAGIAEAADSLAPGSEPARQTAAALRDLEQIRYRSADSIDPEHVFGTVDHVVTSYLRWRAGHIAEGGIPSR